MFVLYGQRPDMAIARKHFSSLALSGRRWYNQVMKAKSNKRARTPKESDGKSEYMEIRLGPAEKQAFKDAADLAGLGVSAWVRERLRRIAAKELQDASRPVAFLEND
jgi:hypothetical protein